MRNMIGSFVTADLIQQELTTWISQYVLGTPNGTREMKSQYPLAEAKIIVSSNPDNPNEFAAVLFLKPHFQMEGMTFSMRLVATIPQG
jgi:type VI secretion system protein ImpC